MISFLKNMMTHMATLEDNPRSYFDRNSKAGSSFINKCRFGHTFHGSFGFNVECPVGVNPQADSNGESIVSPNTPFERRIMERFSFGIKNLQEAILSGSTDPLTRNYDRGFNANICQDLVDMAEAVEDIEIEYSTIWSPEWRVLPELAMMKPVKIERRSIEYLQAASKSMRSDLGESRKQEIKGFITKLQAITNTSEEEDAIEERTLAIKWKTQESKEINVNLTLSPEDYRKACDAYRDRKEVAVSGVLEKINRTSPFQLTAPENFRVVQSTT